MKKNKIFILVAIFYLLLTIVFTWPLVLHFNSAIYGLPGDTFGSIWWFWYFKTNLFHLPATITILNAPFNLEMTQFVRQPTIEYAAKFLLFFFNGITAYNLLLFISFVLSGLAMFFLVRYLFKNNLGAFLAGLIYMVCPYRIFHSYEHLSLLMIGLIPFYLLFLIKTIKEGRLLNLFLTVFFFIVITLENYYYGFFLVVFTVLALVFYLLIVWVKKEKKFFRWQPILIFILGVVLTGFILVPLLNHYLKSPPPAYVREARELAFYVSHWQNYLLPSIDHPVFGKFTYPILRQTLGQSNFFEQTLYLGIVPLLLALFGCWQGLKKKNDFVFLFLLSGLLFLILSHWPPLTLYQKLPMFRVYSRMGLFVLISVAILAGYGFSQIRLKSKISYSLLAILVIGVVIFEFLNFPPAKIMDIKKWTDSQIYQTLKNKPGDFIVANYPFVRSDEERQMEYQLAQIVYDKKMINGAPREGPAEDQRRFNLFDIEKPTTIDKLQEFGVSYVLIHKDVYREGRLPEVLWRYYDPNYKKYPEEYYNGRLPEIKDQRLVKEQEDENLILYKIK